LPQEGFLPLSDDNTTSTEPTTNPDTNDTSAADQQATEQRPPAPTTTAGSLGELPEWAQTEIRRARNDAAKYRRERNAIQKALADKDTSDDAQAGDRESRAEIDRLTGELTTAQRDAARLRAALAADIPATQVTDFAARLVGDTDEELAADAVRLRELLGLPAAPPERQRPDPSQGAGVDNPATTPAEVFSAFIQDRLK
jgi:hypothetical protein